MSLDVLLLSVAVLIAAALQTATGIGFGVIAGPVLLAVLNDATAIQISIVLNLLIAVVLAPALRHSAQPAVLKSFVIGVLVGAPLGLLLFAQLEIAALKVLAALAVLLTLILLLGNRGHRALSESTPSSFPERFSIGVVAGTMGSSLAMPGPVPAAWMAARGFGKHSVRATIVVLFVVAYTVALALQAAVVGVRADTLVQCAALAPATLIGISLGHVASRSITERVFRMLLIGVLTATVALLLLSLSGITPL